MRYWLIGNISLLLFGFVVFLVFCCVVYVVYIVCKTLFKALFFVRKTIYILKDRKKTLASIPDLDVTLVNKRHILSYLAYDNRLLRLYKGPDKNGRFYVPEGIETIDEHAFDDFLDE